MKMLLYAQDNPNYTKYGSLDREGLTLQVILGDTGEDIFLEGVKVSFEVSTLYQLIQQHTGIHPSRQRLFIGGEEMKQNTPLLDYVTSSHVAYSQTDCSLTLRCYIPLLLSTLQCPGPMLTEIEVSPKNDEPVFSIKKRIRDKFRIDIKKQRLYMHPAEMTSFSMRRPLNDARLLSAYLCHKRDGNFLELVVIDDNIASTVEDARLLFIKVPQRLASTREIIDINNLKYSPILHCHPDMKSSPIPEMQSLLGVDGLPPPPPPQTPESDTYKEDISSGAPTPVEPMLPVVGNTFLETWWITIPVETQTIIKRDPKVEDITKLFSRILKRNPFVIRHLIPKNENNYSLNTHSSQQNFDKKLDNIILKFCATKFGKPGKVFHRHEHIYEDLLMRREEALAVLLAEGAEERFDRIPFWTKEKPIKQPENKTTVSKLKPLTPLESYKENQLRFTTPPNPVSLSWNIDSSNTIDCGATPGAIFELTGVSFSRCYGSWDIPEHRKTFVELTVEGMLNVGDSGLTAILVNQEADEEELDYNSGRLMQRKALSNTEEEQSRRIVYYVQDAIEIKILGPGNPTSIISRNTFTSKPFGESMSLFVADRRSLFDFQQEVRQGEFKNPPMPRPAPFYMRTDKRCLDKPPQLSQGSITPSWDDRRQLSEISTKQWRLSRERLSDVSVASATSDGRREIYPKAFSTRCERGVTLDGRPYLNVRYNRRIAVESLPGIIFPRSQVVDSIRKSLDFRIQAQFFISHLINDTSPKPDTADFVVGVRQYVTRIHHVEHSPDECVQYQSPSKGMETTIKVKLATAEWHASKGFTPVPTIELQKASS